MHRRKVPELDAIRYSEIARANPFTRHSNQYAEHVEGEVSSIYEDSLPEEPAIQLNELLGMHEGERKQDGSTVQSTYSTSYDQDSVLVLGSTETFLPGTRGHTFVTPIPPLPELLGPWTRSSVSAKTTATSSNPSALYNPIVSGFQKHFRHFSGPPNSSLSSSHSNSSQHQTQSYCCNNDHQTKHSLFTSQRTSTETTPTLPPTPKNTNSNQINMISIGRKSCPCLSVKGGGEGSWLARGTLRFDRKENAKQRKAQLKQQAKQAREEEKAARQQDY